jgi:sortase B
VWNLKDRRAGALRSGETSMTGKNKAGICFVLKPRLRFILLVGFAAVLILSVSMLILYYTQGAEEENAFKELAEIVKDNTAPSEPTESARVQAPVPESASQGILAQYEKLHKQNPDMAGWISVGGTLIDYPVMYTPDDGDFYLDHGFDKQKTKSGVPFIDARCAVDPLGTNTIIYGHHMKSGAMFAALENYKDKDYCSNHPTIRFDTLYEQQEYEIVAAFESQVFQKNDTAFKYYNYTNIDGEEIFNEYISNIEALSLYDTGMTASYGDALLTLVTCDYHTENGRFVVVARKK